MGRKGFAPILLAVVVAALIAGAAVWYYVSHTATTIPITATETTSSVPIITSSTPIAVSPSSSEVTSTFQSASSSAYPAPAPGMAAVSLHLPYGNSPISWKEGDFEFSLKSVSFSHDDPEYQGAAIGQLNRRYGVVDNGQLTILNIQAAIYDNNFSGASGTAPFDLIRITDESGDREKPYKITTADDRPFALQPGDSVVATASFVVSENDNNILIAVGSPPGLYFIVSRIPANDGSEWVTVQETLAQASDCTPVFWADKSVANLILYQSCPNGQNEHAFFLYGVGQNTVLSTTISVGAGGMPIPMILISTSTDVGASLQLASVTSPGQWFMSNGGRLNFWIGTSAADEYSTGTYFYADNATGSTSYLFLDLSKALRASGTYPFTIGVSDIKGYATDAGVILYY